MKHIYLYTTKTYLTKNWYKIGETTSNLTKRIKEQDNASNPEPLILIANWKVSDKITDKAVHFQLEQIGFEKLRGNREWFELSDCPEQDVKSALNILDKNIEDEPTTLNLIVDPPHHSEIWWGCNGLAPL